MTIEEVAESMMEELSKPETALEVIKHFMFDTCMARANGKSSMSISLDIALCRAVVALEREIKMNKAANCSKLNDNKIWVSNDVYDRITDNPDGVIFEALGERPIVLTWGRVKEDKK